LRQLTLTLYRNYPHLKLDIEDAPVVLCGANGAGKTNILEAISLLSPGRGLRRAAYGDIIHGGGRAAPMVGNGQKGVSSNQEVSHREFVVHARLTSAFNGEVAMGTGSHRTPSGEAARRLRINGMTQPLDTLLEFTRVIWLTPAMDGLFTGAASERRRFLDRLVLGIEPHHGRMVADYDKAMRARNKLLAQDRPDPIWLDALERQMAALAVAIAAARWQFVDKLSALSQTEKQSAFPLSLMELDGILEQQLQQGRSALDVEEEFCALLTKSRHNDKLSSRTLSGPHRSDLKIIHEQKAISAALASTGEQKALLAGIILAHARLTSLISGLTPLLLLDEITAHLDEARVAALFERIEDMGAQAFLTGTQRSLFHHLEGRGQFITIRNNQAF